MQSTCARPNHNTDELSVEDKSEADASGKCWFINPTVDLLFCCGGIMWILVACHFAFGWHVRNIYDGPGIYAGSIAALIGVLCFSDAHVAAGLFRFYGTPALRRRSKLVSYVVPTILAALACASLFSPSILAIGLRVYLLFITHHLAWQTYGIASLYCKKQGCELSQSQRRSLKLFFSAVTIHGMAQQIGNPKFLSIESIFKSSWFALPEWSLVLAQSLLIAATIWLVVENCRAIIKRENPLPLPVLIMIATVVLIFSFSIDILKIFWLYVPSFFHGSQYVVVTAAMKLKEQANTLPGTSVLSLLTSERNIGYWCWIIATGITLYIGIPTTLAHFGFNLITAFNAIFWTINLHHFFIDAIMWRKPA